MRSLPRLFAVMVAALTAGCVRDKGGLDGSYVAIDMGFKEITPPVTLALARSHRYRFCVAQDCAVGRWSAERPVVDGHGRITITGPAFERWWRAFSVAAYHSDTFDRQRGAQGAVDLDYDQTLRATFITLGAGDAAFVRR